VIPNDENEVIMAFLLTTDVSRLIQNVGGGNGWDGGCGVRGSLLT
jgi:hypothetical protein